MDPTRKDYLQAEAVYAPASLQIGHDYVMHEWERPLIREMVARLDVTPRDHVLEIGFGMGISANLLQQCRPATHTIVEPHPQVLSQARHWQQGRAGVQLIPGYWQQLKAETTRFSAIFFDPFSDDLAAVDEENIDFLAFAACTLLEPQGRLAMFCIHPVLPEAYQRVMYAHYSSVDIRVVPIQPCDTAAPPDNQDGRMISVVLAK